MGLIIVAPTLLDGWDKNFLERRFVSAGISPSLISWPSADVIRSSQPEDVIIAVGEQILCDLTGRTGIDKWQASVLRIDERTIIPCYDMTRVKQDLSLQMWLGVVANKAAKILTEGYKEPEYVFHLNPSLEETLAFLRGPCRSANLLSVDVETGRGQINTVGFAISPTEAIAINTLPDRLGADSYRSLWSAIHDLLISDTPKVLQNFIYEQLYFSKYGIALNGVTHDTMLCQKLLWPEFEMGLDAVGRMYTNLPYWKEDGKSWNNIRDWEKHYDYNCKDTIGTYQGAIGQRADLERRGLIPLHDNYLRRLFGAVSEMCSRGIPLSEQRLLTLRKEVGDEYGATLKELQSLPNAQELNPRSSRQVISFLEGKGYSVPKKYNRQTKTSAKSVDEKSLKKLRLKYPDDYSISCIIKLSKLGKSLSSYLNFTYDSDFRMRYSLIANATETSRMAGYCDPWDHGVNPQTIPGGNKGINIKQIFECTPGRTFMQIDLKQAESRFVAYDAPDLGLIQMLEDPTKDIHSYVGAEIFKVPIEQVIAEAKAGNKLKRQLGKKSGHGANYGEKEQTLIDTCIQEMDHVLTKDEATEVLSAYHRLFPGIRRWHHNLRQELAQTRRLSTPIGHERYFYGRLDDDMFREGYAYRPQTTIPAITNHLMFYLMDLRAAGNLKFGLLLQCHDSLLLEVPEGHDVDLIAQAAARTREWHPRIMLAGGELLIPTSVEVGRNYGELEEYEPTKS